jgi:hypothetical protein
VSRIGWSFILLLAFLPIREAHPVTFKPLPEILKFQDLSPVPDVETGSVTFTFTTNLNLEGRRTLRLYRSGAVKVNGVVLQDSRRISAQPALTEIFKAPKEPLEFTCGAGAYTYSLKVGRKTTVVNGCLESREYNRILRAFNRI